MITYVIIGSAILIIAVLAAVYATRPPFKRGNKTPYIEALHLVLEGKKDEALDLLKKTVRKDTDNIMAYIILGAILREKGFPLRGVKIHRNLLVRGDLNDTEIESILHHLVMDYQKADMIDKAIEMAERLVQRSKRNVKNQQLLLSLYEANGNWDKAFTYRQSINKGLKKTEPSIMALYKVQSGLSYVEQKAEREGRVRFREGLRLDKQCPSAYLYWGDSYRRENRDEEAVNVWKNFIEANPDQGYLAFDRLKEVLFDLGRYGEIEAIFHQILNKNPKHAQTKLQLAEFLNKQGRHEEAIETCREAVEMNPDFLKGHLLLARLLREQDNATLAMDAALDGLAKSIERTPSYTCALCAFTSEEMIWHCPQCGGWNSYSEK